MRFSFFTMLSGVLIRDFTCSMGVYFIDSKMDLKESLQKADQALYKAKKSGKGKCRIYHDGFVEKLDN